MEQLRKLIQRTIKECLNEMYRDDLKSNKDYINSDDILGDNVWIHTNFTNRNQGRNGLIGLYKPNAKGYKSGSPIGYTNEIRLGGKLVFEQSEKGAEWIFKNQLKQLTAGISGVVLPTDSGNTSGMDLVTYNAKEGLGYFHLVNETSEKPKKIIGASEVYLFATEALRYMLYVKNPMFEQDNLKEVNYLNPNKFGEPKKNIINGKTIRVFHGIDRIGTLENILKNGLSGNQKIKRINSNDTASNNGLFITIDFDLAKRYAASGNVIEFTTNIEDLSPVSDGASGTYNYETAYDNLLSPTKSEALYFGDLNPNMIKYIWRYDDKNYTWNRYNRKEFIEKYNIDTKRSSFNIFLPNDYFDMNKIIKLYNGKIESDDFKRLVTKLKTAKISELSDLGFLFPKQIKDVIRLREEDFFNKYL